jgi:hypothetical protein
MRPITFLSAERATAEWAAILMSRFGGRSRSCVLWGESHELPVAKRPHFAGPEALEPDRRSAARIEIVHAQSVALSSVKQLPHRQVQNIHRRRFGESLVAAHLRSILRSQKPCPG